MLSDSAIPPIVSTNTSHSNDPSNDVITPFDCDNFNLSSNQTNFSSTIHEISPNDVIFYFYLWNVIAPVIFSTVTVVGIVGNSLVVFVILTNRRMRSVTNLLLLNLAFTDILCLLICGPFSAYKYVALDWTLGNTTCQLVQYVLYVTVYVTIYTLVIISAQRYFTIVRGHKMKVSHYRLATATVIVALWICTLTLNIPTLLAHRTKDFESPFMPSYTYCGIENSSIEAVFVSFFVVGYAIPLLIICTLYFLIMNYLRSHSNTITTQTRRCMVQDRRTTKTCRVIAAVVVVFGISWLPHHVNSFLALARCMPDNYAYDVLRVVWMAMSYGNSCINPFIYNYASTEFKVNFMRVFGCRRRSDSISSVGVTLTEHNNKAIELELL